MQNPFSKRNTTSSGSYIEKKRNLTKIMFLKNLPDALSKTNNYIVQPQPQILLEKDYSKEYPKENCTPDIFRTYYSYDQQDLFFNYYGEEKNSPQIKTICKKCSNTIFLMKTSPNHWLCDGWDPPNSSCKGNPNGTPLNESHQSFACPNHTHCNWIICKACYEYLNNENKKKKNNEPNDIINEPNDIINEPTIDYETLIDEEKKYMIEQGVLKNRKNGAYLKCIRSYKEYLDLAKGFHLTEPFCEVTYPNACENTNNGKLVNNICEGQYSVLDMGEECLYTCGPQIAKHKNCLCGKCDICKKAARGRGADSGLLTDCMLTINKCRKEKGLLNIRGTVTPKLKTENILKFPIMLKKTAACNEAINWTGEPDIHDIQDKKVHTHWFPTNDKFITYTHKHKGHQPIYKYKNAKRVRKRYPTGPHNKGDCSPSNNFPKHPFSGMGFNNAGKRTVTTLNPPIQNAHRAPTKVYKARKRDTFSFGML